MKQLSLRYEDKDYHKLKTAKDKTTLTWERFVLTFCTKQKINPFKFKTTERRENGNKKRKNIS